MESSEYMRFFLNNFERKGLFLSVALIALVVLILIASYKPSQKANVDEVKSPQIKSSIDSSNTAPINVVVHNTPHFIQSNNTSDKGDTAKNKEGNIYNVSSHNQSGGITVGHITYESLPPRKLDSEVSAYILSNLPQKDKLIRVGYAMGDNEAGNFASFKGKWIQR